MQGRCVGVCLTLVQGCVSVCDNGWFSTTNAVSLYLALSVCMCVTMVVVNDYNYACRVVVWVCV